jgi:hypothetical protein
MKGGNVHTVLSLTKILSSCIHTLLLAFLKVIEAALRDIFWNNVQMSLSLSTLQVSSPAVIEEQNVSSLCAVSKGSAQISTGVF